MLPAATLCAATFLHAALLCMQYCVQSYRCCALLCSTLFFGNYDANVLAVALDTLSLVSMHVYC
jgi:hypothetical protein